MQVSINFLITSRATGILNKVQMSNDSSSGSEMSLVRKPVKRKRCMYTPEKDQWILDFVAERSNAEYSVGGNRLWKATLLRLCWD